MTKELEKVGKISALIILLLAVISIVYETLGLDFEVMHSIIESINDASAFITIICVSFAITSIIRNKKRYGLMGICCVDILLVNRLYSNEKWSNIIIWLKSIDKRLLLFGIFVCALVVYWFRKNVHENEGGDETKLEHENITDPKLGDRDSNIQKQINSEKDKSYENKEKGEECKKNLNQRTVVNLFILAICLGVIIWGALDYMVFNLLTIEIDRPPILDWIPSTLYYCAIICVAILVVLVIVNLIISWRKKSGDKINSFRLSAVMAVIIEVIILIFADNIIFIDISDNFLSAITENWFSSIFAIIILFIILQIAIIIVFRLLNVGTDDNKIVKNLEDYIKKIEIKLIKLACNIAGGCIALFDFIPDFFVTIGYILLDKKIEPIVFDDEISKDSLK